MSPTHQHSRRSEFQELRSEQTQGSLVAKRTSYITLFLSPLGTTKCTHSQKDFGKNREYKGVLQEKWPWHPLLFWDYKLLRLFLEIHKPKASLGVKQVRKEESTVSLGKDSVLAVAALLLTKTFNEVWAHEWDVSWKHGFLWWGWHWRVSSPTSPQHHLSLLSGSSYQKAWTAWEEHACLHWFCDLFQPKGIPMLWAQRERKMDSCRAKETPGLRYLSWPLGYLTWRQVNIQYRCTHWLLQWILWLVCCVTQSSA